MPTPYTTKTGVKIGLLYQPRRAPMSRDEELIQSVLLNEPIRKGLNPWLIFVLLIVAYAVVSCMR